MSQYNTLMRDVLTDEPQREPQLNNEMRSMDAALDELEKVLTKLITRLEPVSLPRPQEKPLAGDIAKLPQPVLCSVASALYKQRQKLEGMISSMRTAISTLEV